MKHRFVQVTPKGVWVSQGVFDDILEAIAANVIRSYVLGQPRAAIGRGQQCHLCNGRRGARDGSARVFVRPIHGCLVSKRSSAVASNLRVDL